MSFVSNCAGWCRRKSFVSANLIKKNHLGKGFPITDYINLRLFYVKMSVNEIYVSIRWWLSEKNRNDCLVVSEKCSNFADDIKGYLLMCRCLRNDNGTDK